jgi:hypothetical protein
VGQDHSELACLGEDLYLGGQQLQLDRVAQLHLLDDGVEEVEGSGVQS